MSRGVAAAILIGLSRRSVYARHFALAGPGGHLLLLVVACAAALVGTAVGSRIIGKVTFRVVRIVAGILLVNVAVGLAAGILWKHFIDQCGKRNDHFTFDGNEQLAAYRAAEEQGAEVIGVYHSHPATPARPSVEDIRLAHDPCLIYVIVSLLDRRATVKTFRIRNGEVTEEIIEYKEEP